MTRLQSEYWSASEVADYPDQHHEVVVTGKVEVTRSNIGPVLKMAVPQGANPRILVLELSEEDGGGTPAVPWATWENAVFSMTISPGQYDQVTILGQATVDVFGVFLS